MHTDKETEMVSTLPTRSTWVSIQFVDGTSHWGYFAGLTEKGSVLIKRRKNDIGRMAVGRRDNVAVVTKHRTREAAIRQHCLNTGTDYVAEHYE